MSNLKTVCWSPPSSHSRTRLQYTWTSWHMGSDPFSTVFQQKTLVSDFEVLSSRQTLVHHLQKAADEAFKKSLNTMKVNTLCSYTSTGWPVTTAQLVPPNWNNFGKMTGDSSLSSETWLKTPSIVSRSSRLYLVLQLQLNPSLGGNISSPGAAGTGGSRYVRYLWLNCNVRNPGCVQGGLRLKCRKKRLSHEHNENVLFVSCGRQISRPAFLPCQKYIIYTTHPPLVFCHITNYHRQVVACKCNSEETDGINKASPKCQAN